MWIFLSDAFVSIVEDHQVSGNLLVRARRKGDVERFLRPAGVQTKATFSRDRDYAYRASVHRADVDLACSVAAQRVDYPNFKDAVEDDARHDAYLSVWAAMLRFQKDRRRSRHKLRGFPARFLSGREVLR